jgi:hypothetical protein
LNVIFKRDRAWYLFGFECRIGLHSHAAAHTTTAHAAAAHAAAAHTAAAHTTAAHTTAAHTTAHAAHSLLLCLPLN